MAISSVNRQSYDKPPPLTPSRAQGISSAYYRFGANGSMAIHGTKDGALIGAPTCNGASP